MFLRYKIRALFLVFVMSVALVSGAPITPDQIQDLLRQMSRPKIAHVLRDEADRKDAPDKEPE